MTYRTLKLFVEREKQPLTKLLIKQGKEGAFIAGESDVVYIYIRARERDARITPPLFPASLIFPTLSATRTPSI